VRNGEPLSVFFAREWPACAPRILEDKQTRHQRTFIKKRLGGRAAALGGPANQEQSPRPNAFCKPHRSEDFTDVSI
jgi:hypothetical protein